MPFFHVRGIEIHAEVVASGPRLLVIWGSGADLRQRPPALERLAAHFEVLAYDQRGRGRTSKPDVACSMADYADDAAALLDAVGWDACAVLGWSFGGMVAQELGLRHPSSVTRAVLAASSSGGAGGASYPVHEYAALTPQQAARLSLEVQDTRRNEAWQAVHPDIVASAIRQREHAHAAALDEPERAMGLRRQLEARALHDTYDRRPSLAIPVLVAGGRYDGQAPPANQEALRRAIPGARLEFFEGGHGFLREDPAALPRLIEWLLAQQA